MSQLQVAWEGTRGPGRAQPRPLRGSLNPHPLSPLLRRPLRCPYPRLRNPLSKFTVRAFINITIIKYTAELVKIAWVGSILPGRGG